MDEDLKLSLSKFGFSVDDNSNSSTEDSNDLPKLNINSPTIFKDDLTIRKILGIDDEVEGGGNESNSEISITSS